MKTQASLEKIIVLDFGSQYNQLITRRIREFGVFSELLPKPKVMSKGLSSQGDHTASMLRVPSPLTPPSSNWGFQS